MSRVGASWSVSTSRRPCWLRSHAGAPVVAVRDVVAGTGVGYGHTWRAKRATRLVTVPVGYADGIPRGAAGACGGVGWWPPLPGCQLGINMDQTVIDVGRRRIELGSPWSSSAAKGRSLVEWAEWAQTLPHEILTGLGGRVARRYSGVSRDQR